MSEGNGLMNHGEMIDSLIVDCDTAIKQLTGGNHVAWASTMVRMVQKLATLKKGVLDELKSREDTIEELRRQIQPAEMQTDNGRKKRGDHDGNG